MFKLKLKNYRGFLDEEFDFSRVNILIGENSAGKSSIFKFLLALKQSFRSPNNRESNLTFSGNDVDLGNYQEVIYNHEIQRNLSFSFEFKKDYLNFFLDYMAPIPEKETASKEFINKSIKKRKEIIKQLGKEISTPTSITFEVTNDLSKHKNILTKIFNEDLGEIEIIHSQSEIPVEQDLYVIGESPKCDIHFHSKEFKKTFIFQEIEFEKEGFVSMINGENLKFKTELQEKKIAKKLYSQIGFLLVTQNYVSLQLSGIEYINPLISKPAERIYIEGDRKNTRRIRDVKDLIDYLSSNLVKPDFKKQLTSILSDFGIADEIDVKREGYTKELRIKLDEINNNIKDVGFGVSLQLPIFAQAINSEETLLVRHGGIVLRSGETLLIEQPEVHLHPRLQAKFIEALLKIGSNNLYFIETHSEHIIRMLQIIVKEKRHNLSADDVSIHYFRKSGKNMVTTKHKIDNKTGKLIPSFPKGFYDVSYDLAFQLMD